MKLSPVIFIFALAIPAHSQGTKLWTIDRYEELERGTADKVAIRSDGRIEPGPATSLLVTTGGSYLWSLATDAGGTAYLGTGGTTANSATVLRVSPAEARAGKSTRIFEGRELAVQALRVTRDGTLFLVTSPDGKLYRIAPNTATAAVIFDPATTAEKPKYLWDLAVAATGEVYVAAGAPAAVYRIPVAGGPATLLFKTSDQHIRCLLLAPDGTLYAGSDGSGVIYRVAPSELHANARPFAVYAAPRREITALALAPDGTVYAAGVGTKSATNLPPLPVTGNVAVSITFAQPGSSTAASANTILPDGSEIYRIAPDGAPSHLLTLKDDIVYALTLHNGALLAATGNRGRIYRVDLATPGQFTDLAHLEVAQLMAFSAVPSAGPSGLLVATSNSAKLYRLDDAPAPGPSYTSPVFDAGIFAQWGRPEVRSASPSSFDLALRTGNVESPLSGWSEWTKLMPDQPPSMAAPPARYAQWRATFHPSAVARSASLDSVAINYLARNLAPVVDEVVVQPGARIAQPAPPSANATVQIAFPTAATMGPAFVFPATPSDAGTAPLTAQKDRTAVTIRWSAHDDNGDELTFSLWFRGDAEANWHLLKDRLLGSIAERVYSFDSALLPDGVYTIRVVASDAPSHTPGEALSAEKTSAVFTIDTTPPVPSPLVASIGPDHQIHARFDARDATSPIARAEYSVDAGPWQYLEPTSRLSDSLTEHYDFIAAIPITNPATPAPANPSEHLLAVRIYDRYENMATIKTLIH